MSADDTLRTLIEVAQGRPTPRPLVCPVCEGEVTLAAGKLVCKARHTFGSLAELEVRA